MNGRNMNGKPLKNGRASRRRAASCVALICLFAAAVWTVAQAQSPAPQNMLGVWQGFFQELSSDPQIPPVPRVLVRSEITSQELRRINGVMEVGGIEPCVLTFNGTVAASDRVNVQGRHEEHHGVAKLDLHDFGGGAAILDGSLALLVAGGRVSDGSLLLLRPFSTNPDDTVPNPAGSYGGTFQNADGTKGDITAELEPPDPSHPTSFSGRLVIAAFGARQEFELLGTINAAGLFIAIGQAPVAGPSLSLNGTYVEVPDANGSIDLTGSLKLAVNDGTVHEGTFSMRRER
ncbi:MAG TPA: hypothetical protein VFH31_13880 [Pyrinomonadaceae bacterium]|nr:hypothetical protein [Pyrinomonadaceae bacterium]